MVLLENLGEELGDEYILVKINRDVRFMDEIKEKAEKVSEMKIRAWGNAINLAVRLALEAVESEIPDFSIGDISIGTQEDVEMKNGRSRPLSWIEIELKK
ncbi:MAG: hypothetical protein ACTSVI_11285 [Promethearchaeota archaeon]